MASRGRRLVIHTSTENKCVSSDLANGSVVDVNGRINPLYEPPWRVLVSDRRYNRFHVPTYANCRYTSANERCLLWSWRIIRARRPVWAEIMKYK